MVNEDEYIKEHRKLRNNEFYKTSIRQLSRSNFFFPTPRLFGFSCLDDNENNNKSDISYSRETSLSINGTREIRDNEVLCTFKNQVITAEVGWINFLKN